MSDIKDTHALQKLIHMNETARMQYLGEKAAKIQPFLNENAGIAIVTNSAINAVVLAHIQHSGVPSDADQEAVFKSCVAMAEKISTAQLKRKWQDFQKCVIDQREAEISEHLVWAAEQAGVDLTEATLKGLIREADARKAKLLEEH